MGFIKGILRTATSPIEVASRTLAGVLDFDDIDSELTGLDIVTFGATRVIRKGALAVKETTIEIVRDINE